MDILNTVSLESNSQIKINFDGGDLSSDAGLLLSIEFLFKIRAVKLINRMFKTNDTAWFRIHKDNANLMQAIYQIISELRKVIYSIKKPEFMLFDIGSTLLDTYGNLEEEGFNCHYQAHGYHPLLCYDGLTGDLLKAGLRDGTMYCNREADLYEVLEDKNCKYAIRLKGNARLRELAEDENQALYRATKFNQVDYAAQYGELLYQAGS